MRVNLSKLQTVQVFTTHAVIVVLFAVRDSTGSHLKREHAADALQTLQHISLWLILKKPKITNVWKFPPQKLFNFGRKRILQMKVHWTTWNRSSPMMMELCSKMPQQLEVEWRCLLNKIRCQPLMLKNSLQWVLTSRSFSNGFSHGTSQLFISVPSTSFSKRTPSSPRPANISKWEEWSKDKRMMTMLSSDEHTSKTLKSSNI